MRGFALANGTMAAFLGIPYAAPPVGSLRWRAPVAPQPWSAPRDATVHPPGCLNAHKPGSSEDCLYINVWTPLGADGALPSNRPVMVFIHGGAFTSGSIDICACARTRCTRRLVRSHARAADDGSQIVAQTGHVFVSLQCEAACCPAVRCCRRRHWPLPPPPPHTRVRADRLGALGFLALPEMRQEQGTAALNYGMRDQAFALQWVQGQASRRHRQRCQRAITQTRPPSVSENIAHFGGNASSVFIFGESAGGASVSLHLAMSAPGASVPLRFAAAAMESPGPHQYHRAETMFPLFGLVQVTRTRHA